MKRLIMNADEPGGIGVSQTKQPQPPHQSLVKVTAFSLNRGEVNFAWSETPRLASDLLARRFSGKAVLKIR